MRIIMISVNEEVRQKLTSADYAVAGGVSGVVTRCSCQPLDVIKIRFQLQVEPIRKDAVGVKYWSISQATQQIIKDEGISALWKGHVPAQLLSVLYGVAQFSSFEFFSKVASKESQISPFIHFICGASAGCFATVASFPCDVIRTRLVAQGEPKVYSGICDAALKIYTKEGSKAFFKGLSPTLIQVAPHTGAQFAFYAGFKEVWRKLVYPFDLARKRLQVQGFEEAREKFGKVFRCSGLMDCLWVTLKEEKVRGLFKGLNPSLIKAGTTTAIHFCAYEQMCHILTIWHSKL
ncbi:Mitochondrial uncoupling protein Bmcp [Gryllus bimaculatus]|nr:Mitochondrial uncoupling protein Bmcp [Gryllus bimaculatus]